MRMNNSSVNEEKLKKLSSQYKSCLDRWQNQVRAGKVFLESILEIRKESDHPDSHEEDKSGLPDCHQRFQLELQEDCKGLQSAAQKFQLISRDIDSVEQKVTALAELEIFSTSQILISDNQENASKNLSTLQKVSESLRIVNEAYKDQTKLMLNVAENVGVCSSFDQVVFYAAIWTHQPSLDQKFFIADQILGEYF